MKKFQASIFNDVLRILQREDIQKNLKTQNIDIDMIRFIIEEPKYLYGFLEDIKIDKIDKKFNEYKNAQIAEIEEKSKTATQRNYEKFKDVLKSYTKEDGEKILLRITEKNKKTDYDMILPFFLIETPSFEWSGVELLTFEVKAHNIIEPIAIEIIKAIGVIIKRLDKKRLFQHNEKTANFLKDLIKSFNSAKKAIYNRYAIDIDDDFMYMILKMNRFIIDRDFNLDWEYEDLEEIGEYFNIKEILAYYEIEDPTDEDLEKLDKEADKISLKKTIGIDLYEEEEALFIETIHYLYFLKDEIESLSKLTAKLNIKEREDIQDYLYAINDFFGLGIKKSINDNMFVNLVTYGYYDYKEKQSHGKNAKK